MNSRYPQLVSEMKDRDISLLITDFDGVHTDNSALVGETGDEFVRVNRGDGLGIELLVKSGVQVVILTSDISPIASFRAKKLQIPCFHSRGSKLEVIQQKVLGKTCGLEAIAYLGNDINDKDCMSAVGTAIAVADAHPDLLEVADFITSKLGGSGAVREVCDQIRMQLGSR